MEKLSKFQRDIRGEVNIVAMVLLILVVIALVAIFRSEMTDIVSKMFEKIKNAMEICIRFGAIG
ncbi:MAG: Flp1 family type IVb pilin [Acutalibacteraceae bacterium]|nr:Flp1 family type IVb pilin [Acutalibacteraceae bacterium]